MYPGQHSQAGFDVNYQKKTLTYKYFGVLIGLHVWMLLSPTSFGLASSVEVILETAVRSRKYAQALNAPGKFEKALITTRIQHISAISIKLTERKLY